MFTRVSTIFLSLAFFFAMAAGVVSCESGGSKADMLAQKWQIDDIQVDQEMNDQQKQMFDKMMEKMKDDSYFHFKSDGSYEIKTMGKTENGSWKLSDDESKLITSKEGSDKEDKVDIEELSSDKFVMTQSTRTGEMTMELVPAK